MAIPVLSPDDRVMVDQLVVRRRRVLLAAAGATVALGFGFARTKEIHAQQLTGNSLYDQLGGLAGISAVMNDFITNVAGDDRINGYFVNLPAIRIARLKELLIQQVANASGGPVDYTGGDMKSVHAGLGITMDDFNALVEDLVAALDGNGVSPGAKRMLLGALAPMASDIVTA
jgi:hemoglobin